MIAGSIIGLAHNLKLNVIAEGIEKIAQIKVLNTLGCKEFQGSLFSCSISEKEFTEQLAQSTVQTKTNSGILRYQTG